jgi:hypothetical protein
MGADLAIHPLCNLLALSLGKKIGPMRSKATPRLIAPFQFVID